MAGFFFFSCRQPETALPEGCTPVQLRLEDEAAPLLLSRMADSLRYIPLETNDSSLIGYPAKLVPMDNGNFLILDADKANAVLMFDARGRFLRPIGTKGQGPSEFLQPSDVVYAYGHIYVLDALQKKILKYTAEGSFVETFRLPAYAYYFCCVAEDVFALGFDFTANPELQRGGQCPNLLIFNPANAQQDGYLYFDPDISPSAYVATTNNLCEAHLRIPLNDTIYHVDAQGPAPRYVLHYAAKYLQTKNDYVERIHSGQLTADDADRFYNEGNCPQLFNFFSGNDMALFVLQMKGRLYLHLYCPATGVSLEASAHGKSPLENDIDHCPLSLPIAMKGSKLYCLTTPAALQEATDTDMDFQEDDNPVLVEVSLKPALDE